VREDRPATEKSAGEIDRKHPVPGLFLSIEDGAVEEDGRAIEKNIKLSMLLEYGLDHAGYLFCLGDVHLDEAGAIALTLDQRDRFQAARHIPVGHDDDCAFTGETLRSGTSDARCRTRYQRNSILQFRRNPPVWDSSASIVL
jgi:hypothetical protein